MSLFNWDKEHDERVIISIDKELFGVPSVLDVAPDFKLLEQATLYDLGGGIHWTYMNKFKFMFVYNDYLEKMTRYYGRKRFEDIHPDGIFDPAGDDFEYDTTDIANSYRNAHPDAIAMREAGATISMVDKMLGFDIKSSSAKDLFERRIEEYGSAAAFGSR